MRGGVVPAYMLSQLLSRRALVLTLVKRDLKVRYKATALGFLWSFGRPLFLMLIMWGVFSHIVGVKTSIPYVLHLLTGILPWLYLQGSLHEAQGCILANGNVVKKVAMPSIVFPATAVLGNLIHLVLAMVILSVFIVAYAITTDPLLVPGWEIIFLPALVLLQTLLLLGIALFLSSLNVFYRDVGSLAEIGVNAWFYLTPIIYQVQDARGQLKDLSNTDILYYFYLCNPMTPIIVGYRRVLYGQRLRLAPEIADGTLLVGLGISLAISLTLLALGAAVFGRLSRRFADEL